MALEILARRVTEFKKQWNEVNNKATQQQSWLDKKHWRAKNKQNKKQNRRMSVMIPPRSV